MQALKNDIAADFGLVLQHVSFRFPCSMLCLGMENTFLSTLDSALLASTPLG